MFGFGPKRAIRELRPGDVQAMLAEGSATIIDVREPSEFAAGHIPGAANKPLSSFDPASLPSSPDRTVILVCAGGKRSAMALDKCARAGAAVDTHLDGGMAAWIQAKLPVER